MTIDASYAPPSKAESAWFAETFHKISGAVAREVIGKDFVVQLIVLAMVAGGHVLIEDSPGTGKTSLVKALARVLQARSKRVQFTADILPSDITGTSVFKPATQEFIFYPGPVFTNIFLADEINRATPKAQSALLEAMAERQVSVEGQTHELEELFVVLATANPYDFNGTFNLPESQLDRFLIKTSLGRPDNATLLQILTSSADPSSEKSIAACATLQDWQKMSGLVPRVYLDAQVADYVVKIIEKTWASDQLKLGVSVRGAKALISASKAMALIHGRNYVLPDDVKNLAVPVLGHRVLVADELEFDGITGSQIIDRIILEEQVPSGAPQNGLRGKRFTTKPAKLGAKTAQTSFFNGKLEG